MLNVAIYARVSRDEQAENGNIQTQIEFATKYCDLHQLNIVKGYKNDGRGTLSFESHLEASLMLQDAIEKKFGKVLNSIWYWL